MMEMKLYRPILMHGKMNPGSWILKFGWRNPPVERCGPVKDAACRAPGHPLRCVHACADPSARQAPVQMSSQGDRYPVEPKVAGLVFGFNCFRVCPPFWSCEGHRLLDGTLQRVTQVWFYTRLLIYPRLIGDWLACLYFKKRIANPCMSASLIQRVVLIQGSALSLI